MTDEIANRQPESKPSKLGAIIAWLILLFAIFMAILFLSSGNIAERAGGVIIAAAIGFPAAWALYCRTVESKNAQGFSGARKPRRWGRVAMGVVAMLFAGGLILPSPEPADIQPATIEETTVPSTASVKESEEKAAEESRQEESRERESEESIARESAERKSEEERRKKEREVEVERQRLEEERAQAEAERLAEEQRLQAEREAEAERVAAAERERVAQEQARIEQERIQQQQIHQPAPVVPAQTTSYKNCTDVWNRIGGPIYAGQPGYVSGRGKLDGDSDGVGCEEDPR